MSAEPRATMRGVAAAHSQGEQGLKDNLPALLQVSRCRLTQGTVGGVGGDQRRVERRRAMAAAVGLGRAATMASVRAAGDDVARPLSRQHDLTGRQWKRCTCMQMKFFYLELGPAHVHSWNEPTESSLKPCGTPAGSKGSPRTGGRTWRGARGTFKKIPGVGKGIREIDQKWHQNGKPEIFSGLAGATVTGVRFANLR